MLSQSRNRAGGRFSSSHFERGVRVLDDGWFQICGTCSPFGDLFLFVKYIMRNGWFHQFQPPHAYGLSVCPPPELIISDNTLLSPLYESSLLVGPGYTESLGIDGRLWVNCKKSQGLSSDFWITSWDSSDSRAHKSVVYGGNLQVFLRNFVTPKFKSVISNRNICRNAFQGYSNWWNMTEKTFSTFWK